MKKAAIVLTFLSCVLNLNAAQQIDNEDFSITIPDKWLVEKQDPVYPVSGGCVAVRLSLSGDALETLLIFAYDTEMEPEFVLNTQIEQKMNAYFQDAYDISDMSDTSIAGIAAKSVTYRKQGLNGDSSKQKEGRAYAFSSSGRAFFIFHDCQKGIAEEAPALIRSLKIKAVEQSENFTLEQELLKLSRTVNEYKPEIAAGVKFTSFEPDVKNKILVYRYSYANIISSQDMSSYMKDVFISEFPELYRSTPLVQKAAEERYTLRYVGYNNSGAQIYDVSLSPADYTPLLP